MTVTYLALDAGRHPGDPRLERLVGELAIASRSFRELWARHDIFEKSRGARRVAHRIAGELRFLYQTLMPSHEADQLLVTLTVEPGSGRATTDCACRHGWSAGSGIRARDRPDGALTPIGEFVRPL